jgi:formate hydrogenlyase subunit 3/multisubunit Na+/H+ antiporter MnhD subunit
MTSNDGLMLGIFMIIIFILVFAFLAYVRYLRYRETIELAKHGLSREPESSDGRSESMRISALILVALGAVITFVLLLLVIEDGLDKAPLLLGGLVPLAIGAALFYADRLNRQDPLHAEEPKSEDEEEEPLPPHKN